MQNKANEYEKTGFKINVLIDSVVWGLYIHQTRQGGGLHCGGMGGSVWNKTCVKLPAENAENCP